jgi:hypothetical protein
MVNYDGFQVLDVSVMLEFFILVILAVWPGLHAWRGALQNPRKGAVSL